MADHNLTEHERELLRWLVENVRAHGYEDEFIFSGTLGQRSAVELYGVEGNFETTESTLRALQDDGLVSLRPDPRGIALYGTLRQKAFDAVDSNFQVSVSIFPQGATYIANFIQTMSGGYVQGAAGQSVQVTQQVGGEELAMMRQRFEELTLQLTEVCKELLPRKGYLDAMGDIVGVKEIVESKVPDAETASAKARSLGGQIMTVLDVGDKAGGTMQAAILAGQALTILGGWITLALQILSH